MYFHGLKFTSLKFSEDKKWECDADSIHWISETEKTFLCIVYFENLKKEDVFKFTGFKKEAEPVFLFFTPKLLQFYLKN